MQANNQFLKEILSNSFVIVNLTDKHASLALFC